MAVSRGAAYFAMTVYVHPATMIMGYIMCSTRLPIVPTTNTNIGTGGVYYFQMIVRQNR